MRHLILLIFFLLLSSSFDLSAQSVVRGPYLQMVGQETATVRWRTSSNTSSKIWYGLSPSNLNQTKTSNPLTKEHLLELNGLSPNTKYYYAIGSSSGELVGGDDNHYFTTGAEGAIDEPISIWVFLA